MFENIFFLGVHVFERTYDRDELIRLIGVRQRHTEQSLEASQKFFRRRTGFLGYYFLLLLLIKSLRILEPYLSQLLNAEFADEQRGGEVFDAHVSALAQLVEEACVVLEFCAVVVRLEGKRSSEVFFSFLFN